LIAPPSASPLVAQRKQHLDDTASTFEEIQRHVEELDSETQSPLLETWDAQVYDEEAAAEPKPAEPAASPPPTQTEQQDPFAEFDDEELLLDRYAALDSQFKPAAAPAEAQPADAPNGVAKEAEVAAEDVADDLVNTDENEPLAPIVAGDELSGIHLELSDHAEFFEVVVDPYWELENEAESATANGAVEPAPVVSPAHREAASSPPRAGTISLSAAIRRRLESEAVEPASPPGSGAAPLRLHRDDASPSQPAVSPLAAPPQLVVVDEQAEEPSVFDTGRLLERQDYRELFARLKRS
jgi:hypothetical protein